MDHSPPFLATYKSLFGGQQAIDTETEVVECCDLPLIDLSRLNSVLEAAQCKQDIVTAASEWGFFQIVNHGIADGLLARLREEQVKRFRQPFKQKASEKLLDFSDDSYRWGTPTATSLKHLSWSEAYHIPLSSSNKPARSSTIRWFTVRPNPNTLVINIGDLETEKPGVFMGMQAWSNGLYKSVEHRVMPNPHLERFSVAYFMCPSNETVIESSAQPAIYRKFNFGEYRQQVQQDVRRTGHKVGLTRFLA
ncbi:hypothetical protein GW17_00046307 [Ensete ventricosum]|nr:hypothetical protein GW17_00046307 [Ensete ventricosum]RZS17532.1 hypothetical protein BHM03_00049690 [Ensete ventricosum]